MGLLVVWCWKCAVCACPIKWVNRGHHSGHALKGVTYRVSEQGSGHSRHSTERQQPPRRSTICRVTAIPIFMRQDFKPFFCDTEIKGNPDKFKTRSSTVLWWDELLAYKSPGAGWTQGLLMGTHPLWSSGGQLITLFWSSSDRLQESQKLRQAGANKLSQHRAFEVFFVCFNSCQAQASTNTDLGTHHQARFDWFLILPPKSTISVSLWGKTSHWASDHVAWF